MSTPTRARPLTRSLARSSRAPPFIRLRETSVFLDVAGTRARDRFAITREYRLVSVNSTEERATARRESPPPPTHPSVCPREEIELGNSASTKESAGACVSTAKVMIPFRRAFCENRD